MDGNSIMPLVRAVEAKHDAEGHMATCYVSHTGQQCVITCIDPACRAAKDALDAAARGR